MAGARGLVRCCRTSMVRRVATIRIDAQRDRVGARPPGPRCLVNIVLSRQPALSVSD
jgi:hypothetical protein